MKPCTRCLLKELSEEEYFKNIYDYIESIPEEIKAPKEVYEERLTVCKNCNNFINAMCRLCGCFVEVRAVVLKNNCPSSNKYW